MHPDKRIRYTLTAVVGNTLLAISAFCCAFILAVAGLPSEIMATSIAATVGMFVAYGTVVAALWVFGNTRLSVRLLATFVSVAISILLIFVGFGPMNEFSVTANHFLAIVIVAMLWLGLIQNIFGLKLVQGECDSVANLRGQLNLWMLFVWTLGFAVLVTILRADSFTTLTLIGSCLASLLTTSITLAVISVLLGKVNLISSVAIVLTILILSVCTETYFLRIIIPASPLRECLVPISAANCGAVTTALCASISLRLLEYRLYWAPILGQNTKRQNKGVNLSPQEPPALQ